MLISIDGFNNMAYSADPSRLAAQVVSGIGFLGAGTILRKGNSIKGLTTAASLWVCAGVGLAIGGGYYVGGLTTAAIALFSLMSLGAFEAKILTKVYKVLVVQCSERPGLIGDVGQVIGKYNISIRDIRIIRNESIYEEEELYEFTESLETGEIIVVRLSLKLPKDLNEDLFFQEINKIQNVQKGFWKRK
jgi:putative Mg2+ transporter-C (MgtC) family protein